MISVIIPTYNRANCITRSINSVLSQTYSNIELIIVDDHSEDDTEEVIKKLDDTRIKYYKLNENRGACFARNFGIKKAKGEYIAFQDSDDVWHPKKLELQDKVLLENKNEYSMVFCSLEKNYGKTRIVPSPTLKETTGEIFDSLVKGNFISTQTILCKKSVLMKLGGFDESFPALQDWDLCLRIAYSFKIYHIREPLVYVELSENSITNNRKKVLKAMELLINKHKSKLNDSEIKGWLYKSAHIAKSANEFSKSKVLFLQTFDLFSKEGILSYFYYLRISISQLKSSCNFFFIKKGIIE